VFARVILWHGSCGGGGGGIDYVAVHVQNHLGINEELYLHIFLKKLVSTVIFSFAGSGGAS
jgi:hypothetical protein